MPDKHEVGGSSPLGPTSYFLLKKKANQRKLPIIFLFASEHKLKRVCKARWKGLLVGGKSKSSCER